MTVSIHIDYSDVAARKTIETVKERLLNLMPVMQDFGERMRTSTERNFQVGGRPTKWKPSKKISIGQGMLESLDKGFQRGGRLPTKKALRKAQRLAKGKTLIDTAVLKNSITYQPGKDFLWLGTVVPYARIHQLGGRAGRGLKTVIPARPFLVFQKENIEYFRDKLMRYITSA